MNLVKRWKLLSCEGYTWLYFRAVGAASGAALVWDFLWSLKDTGH